MIVSKDVPSPAITCIENFDYYRFLLVLYSLETWHLKENALFLKSVLFNKGMIDKNT